MGKKVVSIYSLTDPPTNYMRYIGKTTQSLKRRLSKSRE